jgi:hypothetical protein
MTNMKAARAHFGASLLKIVLIIACTSSAVSQAKSQQIRLPQMDLPAFQARLREQPNRGHRRGKPNANPAFQS